MSIASHPELAQKLDLAKYRNAISRVDTVRVNGHVAQVVGVLVESNGPACGVGDICRIECGRTKGDILAEAVGFRESRTLLMPFGRYLIFGPAAMSLRLVQGFVFRLDIRFLVECLTVWVIRSTQKAQ